MCRRKYVAKKVSALSLEVYIRIKEVSPHAESPTDL